MSLPCVTVLTPSCGRGRPPSKSGLKPLPSPPGQDSTAAIEVQGDGEGGRIKESLNAPQRLHPLKDNLKVIEEAGINCRTMPVVSLGRC